MALVSIHWIITFYTKRTRERIKHYVIYTEIQQFCLPNNIGCNLEHQSIERTRQLLAYKIVHVLCNLWAHQSSSCRKFLSLFVQVNSSIN